MLKQRATLWRRLLLFLGAVVFSGLLLEGAVRLRQLIKYGSAKNTIYAMALDPVSGLVIPVAKQRTASISINSLGFRGPELAVPKPPGRIRLAFLGASTTFCAEVSSNEATWPHLVWRRLQEGREFVEFDYVNGAVPGYGVESSLRNLEHRIRPLEPDVILIYHAVNDLSKDTKRLAVDQGIWRPQPDDFGQLARWSLTWFLIQKNLEVVARGRGAAGGAERLAFDARALSGGFREKMRQLVQAARGVAPVVAVATFSQRVRPDQSREEQFRAGNTHFYYMPYMSVEGILKGFEEYNRAIREVARESSVILVEGENDIPGDGRHFVDSVHFTARGCAFMAKRVADALAGSEAFDDLVRARRANRGVAATSMAGTSH